MASDRPHRFPLATLMVLNDLGPVAGRLLASIEAWRSTLTEEQWSAHRERVTVAAERLEGEVDRLGCAVVYRGSPEGARSLEVFLRRAGLTTSLNTLGPERAEGQP